MCSKFKNANKRSILALCALYYKDLTCIIVDKMPVAAPAKKEISSQYFHLE